MKKVECRKCRFYKGENQVHSVFPLASGMSIIIDCIVPKKSGYSNSRLVNKNNDCPDFKKFEWWRKGRKSI